MYKLQRYSAFACAGGCLIFVLVVFFSCNYNHAYEPFYTVQDYCDYSCKIYTDLAHLACKRGDYARAIHIYQSALIHHPDALDLYDQLGICFEKQHNQEEALKIYFMAMSVNPHFIEQRFRKTPIPSRSLPSLPHQQLWHGEDLTEKIIYVYAEKGLGDTLQFCRFLSELSKRAKKVLFKPQRPLISFLKENRFDVELVGADVDESSIVCDYYTSLLALPHLLNSARATISNEPYLNVNEQKVAWFKQHLFANDPHFKIGIAWQGDPNHINDKNRSVPLSFFIPLTTIPNVSVYSLQKGPGREQLENVIGIIDLDEQSKDFSDTAAIIKNLDLVITIDSALVHLSGALGKETWMLTPYVTDWRWLGYSEGSRSFWYKDVVKKRQNKTRSWEGVFIKIIKEVKDILTHC